ncbi:MAG: PhoX family phosphatase [Fimbriimonadaceae bacterium]
MEKRNHFDDDPIVRSDEGRGLSFAEVVGRRLSRRSMLRAGLVAGVGFAMAGPLGQFAQAARSKTPRSVADSSPTGLNFEPLVPAKGDDVRVPRGYRSDVLLRWGDPIRPGLSPDRDPTQMTAADQSACFGYNCDFVGYLPLPFGSARSDHGLLGVNHEYINPELMFERGRLSQLSKEQVDLCMEAMGFSVVEVRRIDGRWEYVPDSRFNKRYTATTPMLLTGPARGDDRMKTGQHADGTTCTGTMHNCAAGKTPWGTVLSGEENFQGMFGNAESLTSEKDRRSAERYGLGRRNSEYRFERHLDRLDCGKEPNEAYHFGWVVEIDPYDPEWTPRKRTSLGRFRHEAATSHVTKHDRVVMYSGDDARFEYVYKFVCAQKYDAEDRTANRDLLDDGVLYVAVFNDDGTGVWKPLVYGEGPLTPENGFDSQADVVIDARIAADLLGATKMDRPEDIEVNPVNQKVYVVCTNNRERGREGRDPVNAANPRPENRHGHIIELTEDDDDHAATTFRWEMFLVCGDPADPSTHYAGFDKSQVSPISCPDNICFDAKGNLWIATDGQQATIDQRDGFFAVPVEGPDRGRLVQFLESVEGSEVCGPEFTPDGTTAFLAIQHPGEGSDYADPSTRWPDGKGVPRPSVIAVQAEGGGVIGERGSASSISRRDFFARKV